MNESRTIGVLMSSTMAMTSWAFAQANIEARLVPTLTPSMLTASVVHCDPEVPGDVGDLLLSQLGRFGLEVQAQQRFGV